VTALRGCATFVLVLASALGAGCKSKPVAGKEPIKVAAAADLAFAFKDVGALYEKQSGRPVTFSFGSTGLLAKQLAEGAPFDVFAAANQSFVDDVVKAGACDADSKSMYARGQIVMWTTDASKKPAAIGDLTGDRFAKIAIANPSHAPYGRAAREALQKAGLWGKVEPKIVFGENVEQTLQFAQSGNADVAIVALSLASVSGGAFTPIDDALHAPIDQAMVACKHGVDEAAGRDFEKLVSAPEGRAVMRRYGFVLPGEQVTTAR
jgi:molybdate transport system substrate-binding protein